MASKVEVLPVVSEEVVQILGSLNIEELNNLLNNIGILRKNGLPDEAVIAAYDRRTKTPPMISL